jgi:hypothetical protein
LAAMARLAPQLVQPSQLELGLELDLELIRRAQLLLPPDVARPDETTTQFGLVKVVAVRGQLAWIPQSALLLAQLGQAKRLRESPRRQPVERPVRQPQQVLT